MNEYDIGKAFEAIEDELIASMMRNMKRHRDWENAEGFNWSMWQAEQLKALNNYKRQNKKKFSKQFGGINGSIKEVIEQARKQGNMDQEIQILSALKKGWKPKRRSGQIDAAKFFRMNDRKLNALIRATEKGFERAEVAMLRRANDQYRKVIFNAQVYANTGAGTYEQAVDMATKDFLSSGINCIAYANGARHTMSDYADMAIRTAGKRAYLTGEGEMRKKWGISTVIMNKRGNPCPKCLPFCGKVMIDDVWSGGKASDGPYPLMSTAIAAGLYHPRCKDSHTTYFPGISTPPDGQYTTKEVSEIETLEHRQQRRLYAKRNYEKYSRRAKYSLDDENRKRYGEKASQWLNEYDLAYRQLKNSSNDMEQYKKYKEALGARMPETVEDFTRLKYNEKEAWEELKRIYKSRNYLQLRLDYIYNGEKMFIPEMTKFASKPKVIAGKGSDQEIRVIQRLVDKYGGDKGDWKKVVAKVSSSKYMFDIHWYEKDGIQYEVKLKARKEKK